MTMGKRKRKKCVHNQDVVLDVIKSTYQKHYKLIEYITINDPTNAVCGPDAEEQTPPELLRLLETTIVACHVEKKPDLSDQSQTPFAKDISLHEIVERVIKKLCYDKDKRCRNILTEGYRCQPCGVPENWKLQVVSPNDSVSIITSSPWLDLYARIGSEFMVHLLRDVSVFVLQCSGCYLQVTGCPIVESKAINTNDETQEPQPKRRKQARAKTLLRRRIFLNTKPEGNFAKTHLKEAASRKGAELLITKIFLCSDGTHSNTKTPESKKKPKRLPKRLVKCAELFKTFLRRHKSCPFLKLLNHHCPPDDDGPSQEQQTTLNLKEVKYSQVLGFCRAVCERVVPAALWGSLENKNTFLKNLYRFIRLRRKEKFTLREIMTNINVNDCKFLMTGPQNFWQTSPVTDFFCREELLSSFYLWFMNCYISPLLSNAFTITDHASHHNRVFFFRKCDWLKNMKIALTELTEILYRPISQSVADHLISSGNSLGSASLRFIPKPGGLRPLAGMSARKISSSGKKETSINQRLIDVLCVLHYESRAFPAKLGAACAGLDYVLPRLESFACRLRAMADERPLYFVCVDISNCYNSIKQDKMYEIVKDVLTEERYAIHRFWSVSQGKRNTIKKLYKRVAAPMTDSKSLQKLVEETTSESKLRNAVFVDAVPYSSVTKSSILRTLEKLIFCTIIEESKSYYIQKCGIPQGSNVSSVLCNYYLGHLENSKFPDILSDPDSLLLRWTDDFLLITHSIDFAKSFLFSMRQGFPDYNCYVKPEKTLVNFSVTGPGGDQIRRLEGEIMMPWCGLLINTRTLCIQANYQKFRGKDSMRDTLTVDHVDHPVANIFENLKDLARPKCHPIFVSLPLNTERTVLINMYQTFLYIAYRFHAFARELPKEMQVSVRPGYFFNRFKSVCSFYYRNVAKTVSESISCDVVFCLFNEAILSLLSRKPSRYGRLRKKFYRERKTFSKDVSEKVNEIASVAVVSEFLSLR